MAKGVASISTGNCGFISQFLIAKFAGPSAFLSCVDGDVRNGPGWSRSSPCFCLFLGSIFELKFASAGLFNMLCFCWFVGDGCNDVAGEVCFRLVVVFSRAILSMTRSACSRTSYHWYIVMVWVCSGVLFPLLSFLALSYCIRGFLC